jgi:hypothetical protein
MNAIPSGFETDLWVSVTMTTTKARLFVTFQSRRLDIAEQRTFGSITAYRQPTPILEVASPMRKTKDYWSSVTPNERDGREEPAISTIWR